MFCYDEWDLELKAAKAKPEYNDSLQFQWPGISITKMRKRVRSYQALPPVDRKDVISYKVEAICGVKDIMDSSHSAVI